MLTNVADITTPGRPQQEDDCEHFSAGWRNSEQEENKTKRPNQRLCPETYHIFEDYLQNVSQSHTPLEVLRTTAVFYLHSLIAVKSCIFHL